MSVNILLDSSLSKGESGDFTFSFNKPLKLNPRKRYKAALKRLITMTYSWYNLSAANGNNKLQWRKKGASAWSVLTFPDGQWGTTAINTFLQGGTGLVDSKDVKKGYIFSLSFKESFFRVIIKIAAGYEIDFTLGEFAGLIGFEKKTYDSELSIGSVPPNLTNGVDDIHIHCSLVRHERSTAYEDDVLFPISVAGLVPTFPFSASPFPLEFYPIVENVINFIKIRVTDGGNKVIDFNGQKVSLVLLIKETNEEDIFVI